MTDLLNLAEKKLQLNLRAHIKNGSYLMVGAIASLFSNLAISVAFANLLPPSVYGTYKYIQTVVEVVGSFSLTQTSTVVVRSVARGFEGAWKKGAVEMLLWSVIPFLIGSALSVYYLLQENYVLGFSLIIGSVLAPFGKVARLYAAYLNGKQKFKETAQTQLIRSSVPTISLVTLAFYTDSALLLVSTFFLSYFLVDAALSLYVYIREQPNDNEFESDSSLTKHLSFLSLLSVGANHLDKILIFQFVGAAELALYAIATALPQQISIITNGIKTMLQPKISGQTILQLRSNLPKRSVQIGALLISILGLYLVLAPLIFKHLFPVYSDGVLMSQIYAIGVVFLFSMPYRLALQTHEKTKELYYTTIISSILKIVITISFVFLYGIWGAVYAFVVSKILNNILIIFAFYLANWKNDQS